MMRRAFWVTAVAVVLAAGCSFTESDEISRPGSDAVATSGSASTTTAKPSGAEPLSKLAEGEVAEPGTGIAAGDQATLVMQLASKDTAADLPDVDGRYDLTDRVIVAPPGVIDGLVAWGRLPAAVTTDISFAATDGAEVAQGIRGSAAGETPVASGSGSMVVPGNGPLRLVVEEASCCSFTLVRRAGAFSVEVTRAGETPDTLHVVAVPGIDPIVEEGSAEKYVPPAATAKPIGDVAIPDMTMPNSARPPDITDPPPSPEKRATVELPPPVPAGSWCGYLALRGVPFDEAVGIWNGLGRPGHMDADGNGIPCETRY